MKFVKKYGIYVLLIALAVTLISFGSQKENVKEDNGFVYTPKPITQRPVKKDESLIMSLASTDKAEVPVEDIKQTQSEDEPEQSYDEEITINANVEINTIKEGEDEISLAFKMPLKGDIIEPFSNGKMIHSETTNDFRTHDGIDIKADEGTNISSSAYGTVLSVKEDALWGITVTIEHGGGFKSRYCGLSECFVLEGNIVDYGVVIGLLGNTAKIEAKKGPHLHFEILKDDKPLDPESLFY